MSTGVAAWLHFLVNAAKTNFAIVDPLADKLISTAAYCSGNLAEDVSRFLSIEQVFSPELATNSEFIKALTEGYLALSELRADNIEKVLGGLIK